MPDNPVSNEILFKIVERLDAIEQQMGAGFASLTQGQGNLRQEQQALNKRVEEGFAVALRERQALSKRMEEGFAKSAQEYQALANKVDEHIKWVRKEIFEDVSILSNLIEKNHQEFLTFRNQSLKFQSDMQQFQNGMLKFQNDMLKFQSDSQKFQNDMLKFRENTESFQEAVSVFQEMTKGNLANLRRSMDKNEQKSISQEELLNHVLKNIEDLKEESAAFEQRLAKL